MNFEIKDNLIEVKSQHSQMLEISKTKEILTKWNELKMKYAHLLLQKGNI